MPRSLGDRFAETRAVTESLVAPLTPEDAAAQSMVACSPAKWHMAHTTWFFETFVLERFEPVTAGGFEPVDSRFRALFNSYYRTIAPPCRKDQRGLMTRPGLDEVRSYRHAVDDRVAAVLMGSRDFGIESAGELRMLVEIGLQHEQQHQELILADVKHLFSLNPIAPAYAAEIEHQGDDQARPMAWRSYDESVRTIGVDDDGRGLTYDNEHPAHRVLVHAFDLADRLVTNGEYLEFMADGGYERPELWLDAGWSWRERDGVTSPLYWRRDDDGSWHEFTLAGLRGVRAAEPVCHLSFYEAEAFARWAGARLPTEFELEAATRDAAAAHPHGEANGNWFESGALHPRPAASHGDEDMCDPGQLMGDLWEWTRSDYAPYPGYCPPDGALGEYNGKFMSGQYVLRGGSCVTPRAHGRVTYRNFYKPGDRWQFSGLRLARDGGR